MANDRVMLKCKGCGERFCLLRYMPLQGIANWLGPSHVFEGLREWLEKHCQTCHLGIRTQDLEGDPRFETETE